MFNTTSFHYYQYYKVYTYNTLKTFREYFQYRLHTAKIFPLIPSVWIIIILKWVSGCFLDLELLSITSVGHYCERSNANLFNINCSDKQPHKTQVTHLHSRKRMHQNRLHIGHQGEQLYEFHDLAGKREITCTFHADCDVDVPGRWTGALGKTRPWGHHESCVRKGAKSTREITERRIVVS